VLPESGRTGSWGARTSRVHGTPPRRFPCPSLRRVVGS
jgi:hypothetical protein